MPEFVFNPSDIYILDNRTNTYMHAADVADCTMEYSWADGSFTPSETCKITATVRAPVYVQQKSEQNTPLTDDEFENILFGETNE